MGSGWLRLGLFWGLLGGSWGGFGGGLVGRFPLGGDDCRCGDKGDNELNDYFMIVFYVYCYDFHQLLILPVPL